MSRDIQIDFVGQFRKWRTASVAFEEFQRFKGLRPCSADPLQFWLRPSSCNTCFQCLARFYTLASRNGASAIMDHCACSAREWTFAYTLMHELVNASA